MEIINGEGLLVGEENEVGGDWACIIGCGTFCVMTGGNASYIAVVATAL